MIVKSLTMISWELDPFHTRGGTAYAIRRLANQLTGLGIETRVLLPDWLDSLPGKNLAPLFKPMLLKMRSELRQAPRGVQCSEFCRAAVEAVAQIKARTEVDAVIAHSDEGAMFTILRGGQRSDEPSVFWLHSLYDPPTNDFSSAQRQLLPSQSLLASAVMMADIVVTSSGVLQDAQEFEWPDRLRELQQALANASAEHRVLIVESTGCLPGVPNSQDKPIDDINLESPGNVPTPYVLFPSRPAVDKGFGIFAAIAERLRADNITCVAVQRPALRSRSGSPSRDASVYWLPWLAQNELRSAMRKAACTVFPSLTEGFGLAAAESISQGVPTLYQQVGGHHRVHSLPNALTVPLTTSERARLYSLWAELIDKHVDPWSIWARYEVSLRPLIDRWVEAVRSVVRREAGRIENPHFPQRPVEELWGNRICHRIEVGEKEKRGQRSEV